MALFAICPACCEKSDSRIVQQEGTFVKIEQVGFCLHCRPYLIRIESNSPDCLATLLIASDQCILQSTLVTITV